MSLTRSSMHAYFEEKNQLEFAIRHYKPEQDAGYQERQALLTRLIALKQTFPKQPRLAVLEGMLYEAAKQNEIALHSYANARKLFPHCPHAYIYPAQMLFDAGNYKASKQLVKLFNNVFKDDPHVQEKHSRAMTRLAGKLECALNKSQLQVIANTKHIQEIFKNNPYPLAENKYRPTESRSKETRYMREHQHAKVAKNRKNLIVTTPPENPSCRDSFCQLFSKAYNYLTGNEAIAKTITHERTSYRT
jgi:hypothetical protein